MWKYIVTWCVLIKIITPVDPLTDKFGRRVEFDDYKYDIKVECQHSEEFINRQAAFDFYNEAYSIQADTIMRDKRIIYIIEDNKNLINVKIDSIKYL